MSEQLELPGHRIRRIRSEQNLSRQALAEAAHLDLTTVRRIEHGAYARCDEALAIARALNTSGDALFGGVFERLKTFPSNAVLTDTAWNDQTFRQEIATYGVDIHPAVWFLKLRFRGGGEGTFFIAAPDLDRFHEVLAREAAEDPTFFVFDSRDQTIVVNLDQVVHAHSLFEGASVTVAVQEAPQAIEVLLASEKKRLSFRSEQDVSDNPDDPRADQGQLHNLLRDIKSAERTKPFVSFFDQDGEQVAVRVNAVALVTVPHVLLWGEGDREAAPDPPTQPRRPQLKVLEGGR